jgi:hypothetical protein
MPDISFLTGAPELQRLFAAGEMPCACQFWMLRFASSEKGADSQNRFVYARLLPYSRLQAEWHGSYNNDYESIGVDRVQLQRLTVFITSSQAKGLVEGLYGGVSLRAVSANVGIAFGSSLDKKLGDVTIDGSMYVRPVSYLLNRYSYDPHLRLSPHGDAGAYGGAIGVVDKRAIFQNLASQYDPGLADFVLRALADETGLDFRSRDSNRLGEIEALVFPSLNELEQHQFSAGWAPDSSRFEVTFEAARYSDATVFQAKVTFHSDGSLLTAFLPPPAKVGADGRVRIELALDPDLRQRVGSVIVELFGSNGSSTTARLCDRWQCHYIREISFNQHLIGPSAITPGFRWLEKGIASEDAKARARAVQASPSAPSTATIAPNRASEMWRVADQQVNQLLDAMLPPPSDGRFFKRMSETGGLGRLEFAEWFKKTLLARPFVELILFDPHFEDAGIGLLHASILPQRAVTVLTSNRKSDSDKDESGDPIRVERLIKACERLKKLSPSLHLRVGMFRPKDLHDRFMFTVTEDGQPGVGFHLSNSIQKANENFPLLITPIPADVLYQVHQYYLGLGEALQQDDKGDSAENSARPRLIFDSRLEKTATLALKAPDHLWNETGAGPVLAKALRQASFATLVGEDLRKAMESAGYIREGRSHFPETLDLSAWVENWHLETGDPLSAWKIVCILLANSSYGDAIDQLQNASPAFVGALKAGLDASFRRRLSASDDSRAEWLFQAELFKRPLEKLVRSVMRPEQFMRASRGGLLDWFDFFTVRILWHCAPLELVALADRWSEEIPAENRVEDAIKLAMLGHVGSEIVLSLETESSDAQRTSLFTGRAGWLQWLGVAATLKRCVAPVDYQRAGFQLGSALPTKMVAILGSIVSELAHNRTQEGAFDACVALFHKALPPRLSLEAAIGATDALRGHMEEIAWQEPWIYEKVLKPLLDANRVGVDEMARVWADEVMSRMKVCADCDSRLFETEREGVLTKQAAELLAKCSPDRHKEILAEFQRAARKQSQVLEAPLASTKNWARWDVALFNSLWIAVFARWSVAFSATSSTNSAASTALAEYAEERAMRRSREEWAGSGLKQYRQLLVLLMDAQEKET